MSALILILSVGTIATIMVAEAWRALNRFIESVVDSIEHRW